MRRRGKTIGEYRTDGEEGEVKKKKKGHGRDVNGGEREPKGVGAIPLLEAAALTPTGGPKAESERLHSPRTWLYEG